MKALITANLLTVLALPLAAQTVDSPLVAAAKATNAARATTAKKASTVITNDTLTHTGGHMATTDNNTSLATTAIGASQGDSNARAEAAAKAKRDADTAKLELLKKDPLAYYKQYEPDQTKTAYGQASTVTLPTATAVTPTTQSTTVQPASAETKQLNPATTKTPQSTATTQPPTKQ